MPADFQSAHIRARSTASRAFESCWRNLPAEGLVPRKSDLRPDAIASHLKNVVLIEAHFESVPNLGWRVTPFASAPTRIWSDKTSSIFCRKPIAAEQWKAGG